MCVFRVNVRKEQFWAWWAKIKIERMNSKKPASMTIKYLKCRSDLNFKVFGLIGAIGTVVTC